jgi:serine-type D-Ala-D-Ala carboxypeptidase/endopeptidase (penicillin-binding protein 4)
MWRAAAFSLMYCFAAAQPATLVQELKEDPALRNASFAWCVLDAATGSVVTEYNSNQALVPASTLKILTTSAALGMQGAAYRYETRLMHSGSFIRSSGVIDGDLYVIGSGDPSLQSEYFYSENEPVTEAWAAALKEKGVREIRGGVIGLAGAFPRTVPDHWIWCDISNYFGAVPCALSFRDNKYSIHFSTGEKGSLARITEIRPTSLKGRLSLSNSVTAQGTQDEAYIYGDPFGYRKEIRGTLPPGQKNYVIEGALPDPAIICAEYLLASLNKAGIRVGKAASSDYEEKEPGPSMTLLHRHLSPPLAQLVHFTNLKSNNHYCESILATLGKGSARSALEAVKRYWANAGVDTSAYYLADASGLSRANTLTAHVQALVLSRIYNDSAVYRIINKSLAVAAEEGVLRNLGKGTAIAGKLRAKTGYILRARSYCGYVRTVSGRELAFSVIFNNYSCSPSEARKKMERVMVEMGKL